MSRTVCGALACLAGLELLAAFEAAPRVALGPETPLSRIAIERLARPSGVSGRSST